MNTLHLLQSPVRSPLLPFLSFELVSFKHFSLIGRHAGYTGYFVFNIEYREKRNKTVYNNILLCVQQHLNNFVYSFRHISVYFGYILVYNTLSLY